MFNAQVTQEHRCARHIILLGSRDDPAMKTLQSLQFSTVADTHELPVIDHISKNLRVGSNPAGDLFRYLSGVTVWAGPPNGGDY